MHILRYLLAFIKGYMFTAIYYSKWKKRHKQTSRQTIIRSSVSFKQRKRRVWCRFRYLRNKRCLPRTIRIQVKNPAFRILYWVLIAITFTAGVQERGPQVITPIAAALLHPQPAQWRQKHREKVVLQLRQWLHQIHSVPTSKECAVWCCC